MTRRRRISIPLVAIAAGLALASAAGHDLQAGGEAVAQQRGPESAQSKRQASQALTASRSVAVDGRSYSAGEARAAAVELGKDIPLPEGGNFNGIRWEELEGSITSQMISVMLQYNAACQWWRAEDGDRADGVGRDIAGDIPQWNAVRGTEAATLAADVGADLTRGGGPVSSAVVADCEASREREATYAAERGLTPTR
jgi:hypothetical protein